MYRLCKPVLLILLLIQVVYAEPVIAQEPLKSAAAAEQILAARGELIIRFRLPQGVSISDISKIVSVDDFRNDTVTAYANQKGLIEFNKLEIPYEILPPPSLLKFSNLKGTNDLWKNSYPTYAEYESLMQRFVSDFPGICKEEDFGTTINGHRLLALKITDNPGERENEPVIFYTASMHGDEPVGFVMMLHLIDSLLKGYSTSPEIMDLVDRSEIWINPLANPDGAYFLSDSSVEGSTRFNAAQIDLNRDFPEIGKTDIDTSGIQPETHAMISFMKQIKPVLSANFHSGAEVVNYPWDTWQSRPADDSWYRYISHTYADTVQKYSEPGYMTFLNDGITRGIEWYQIYGGRQDYVNFYLNAREVTIELSDNKIPAGIELQKLWEYNKRSLLQYMNNSFTGFAGVVTDSSTGKPVNARIRLLNYDYDNSFVFSRPDDGSYYRLLKEGAYNAVFTSVGYQYKIVPVSVEKGRLTTVNVSLSTDFGLKLYPNPFTDYFYLNVPYSGFELYVFVIDMLGRKIKVVSQFVSKSGKQEINIGSLAPGHYIIHVVYNGQSWDLSGIRKNP
jgi:hypothetical protein